jgi:hypothetical protein
MVLLKLATSTRNQSKRLVTAVLVKLTLHSIRRTAAAAAAAAARRPALITKDIQYVASYGMVRCSFQHWLPVAGRVPKFYRLAVLGVGGRRINVVPVSLQSPIIDYRAPSRPKIYVAHPTSNDDLDDNGRAAVIDHSEALSYSNCIKPQRHCHYTDSLYS